MFESLLFLIVIIPTVVFIFLPWNWYLRAGVWVLVLAAFAFIIAAVGNTGGLEVALLGFLLVFVFMMWGVAGLLQLVLRRLIEGDWPKFTRLRSDFLLGWAGYALLALCLFLFVAFRMAGTSHAIMLHGALFAIALLCFRAPGFAISLAVLTCYSLYYPRVVIAAAESAAVGQSYCIYLNQRDRVASSWKDLTFLTMDKGDFTPHANVIIQDDRSNYGIWSYRQRAFNPPHYIQASLPDVITCATD